MNLFLPSHCLDLFQKCARPKSQPHLPYLSSKIFRGAQGTHFGSIHLQVEIPFRVEIFSLEFQLLFQAEIFDSKFLS